MTKKLDQILLINGLTKEKKRIFSSDIIWIEYF